MDGIFGQELSLAGYDRIEPAFKRGRNGGWVLHHLYLGRINTLPLRYYFEEEVRSSGMPSRSNEP